MAGGRNATNDCVDLNDCVDPNDGGDVQMLPPGNEDDYGQSYDGENALHQSNDGKNFGKYLSQVYRPKIWIHISVTPFGRS